MSDDEVFAYRSVEQGVRESVRPYLLLVMGEPAIAKGVSFAFVIPADVLWSHFHSGEKPCYIIQINGPWSMCHGIASLINGE